MFSKKEKVKRDRDHDHVDVSRREFLKLAGATVGSALLTYLMTQTPTVRAQELIKYIKPQVDLDIALEQPFLTVKKRGTDIVLYDENNRPRYRTTDMGKIMLKAQEYIENRLGTGGIFIYPGTYIVKTYFYPMINNLTILGIPGLTTLKLADRADQYQNGEAHIIQGRTWVYGSTPKVLENITFIGLIFDGNDLNQIDDPNHVRATRKLVVLDYLKNLKILLCEFKNTRHGASLWILKSEDVYISHCRFLYNGLHSSIVSDHMWVGDCVHVIVTNSIFKYCSDTAIACDNSQYITIANNVIVGWGYYGISHFYAEIYSSLGYERLWSKYMTISNVILTGPKYDGSKPLSGIFISSATGRDPYYVTISNVQIRYAKIGLQIDHARRVSISNVSIIECDEGLHVAGEMIESEINNMTIADTSTGIYTSDNAIIGIVMKGISFINVQTKFTHPEKFQAVDMYEFIPSTKKLKTNAIHGEKTITGDGSTTDFVIVDNIDDLLVSRNVVAYATIPGLKLGSDYYVLVEDIDNDGKLELVVSFPTAPASGTTYTVYYLVKAVM